MNEKHNMENRGSNCFFFFFPQRCFKMWYCCVAVFFRICLDPVSRIWFWWWGGSGEPNLRPITQPSVTGIYMNLQVGRTNLVKLSWLPGLKTHWSLPKSHQDTFKLGGVHQGSVGRTLCGTIHFKTGTELSQQWQTNPRLLKRLVISLCPASPSHFLAFRFTIWEKEI